MNMIRCQRRLLSGFKSLPKTKKTTQIKTYDQLTAPDYQMGFKKPETGVLEVETGLIIGGKKEIKIIESDEAYRARIKDARQLSTVKNWLPMMPIPLLGIILYIYVYLVDSKNQPPSAFEAEYRKRKEEA